jgi:hypothetical protein
MLSTEIVNIAVQESSFISASMYSSISTKKQAFEQAAAVLVKMVRVWERVWERERGRGTGKEEGQCV